MIQGMPRCRRSVAQNGLFGSMEGRIVEAAFDAGLVTSDAGALLLGAYRAIDLGTLCGLL